MNYVEYCSNFITKFRIARVYLFIHAFHLNASFQYFRHNIADYSGRAV
jgi:hypothetical protein